MSRLPWKDVSRAVGSLRRRLRPRPARRFQSFTDAASLMICNSGSASGLQEPHGNWRSRPRCRRQLLGSPRAWGHGRSARVIRPLNPRPGIRVGDPRWPTWEVRLTGIDVGVPHVPVGQPRPWLGRIDPRLLHDTYGGGPDPVPADHADIRSQPLPRRGFQTVMTPRRGNRGC